MENMVMKHDFWNGKRVFITGHTGFKGAWLALWLHKLGAIVTGYALAPATEPNFFSAVGIGDHIGSIIGDVRDADRLCSALAESQSEFVFHLAAQPLVRESYKDPANTYDINVMGTVRVLEAVRQLSYVRSVIIVTSDKCYANPAGSKPHVESDPLGGHSTYASSKACAELVTEAYRQSFFCGKDTAVATVRAGNVIGGGDWAPDRLIPDMVKAFDRGQELELRYPDAVRPWQHVLDPLSGYLLLAERLFRKGSEYSRGWNFGPLDEGRWRVVDIARYASKTWGEGAHWTVASEKQPYEDECLCIDSSMAMEELGWRPRLDMPAALSWTFEWYRHYSDQPSLMGAYSLEQIEQFEGLCRNCV
jgi:CDP-glucose 4,6-dehydratase